MKLLEKAENLTKKIESIRIVTNWTSLDIYYWLLNRAERYTDEFELLEEFIQDETVIRCGACHGTSTFNCDPCCL